MDHLISSFLEQGASQLCFLPRECRTRPKNGAPYGDAPERETAQSWPGFATCVRLAIAGRDLPTLSLGCTSSPGTQLPGGLSAPLLGRRKLPRSPA